MLDISLPQHLAIIMDGNGRWARLRNKSRAHGHIKGTRVAKTIITECSRLGIKYLTLYAFSSENWLRPQQEVRILMKILQRYLQRETKNLIKENIRLHLIGDAEKLPKDVQKSLSYAMQATAHCTGLQLIFALSYGARQEITMAMQALARKILEKEIHPDDINESLVNSCLATYPAPDPDLIIRTSGEKRLSNFLLWQAAYSEFYFSPILWPDFNKMHLLESLQEYSSRQRRFGKVIESHEQLVN